MYYIYAIHEREKIGVSQDVTRRMEQHEWNGPYEIIEEHTCIYEVSKREIELQKEYGYPVDSQPYWLTIEKFTKKGGWQTGDQSSRGKRVSKESQRKGGLTNVKSGHLKNISKKGGFANAAKSRKLTFEQAEEIRSKYIPRKYTSHRLAKEYGMSRGAISNILAGITYKEKGPSEESPCQD